ncbi:MAG: hypothetical protein JWQ35_1597 [Bacteriovoracaceae bacterium]|nr:hypothetical protein [Bacteriovoracaceae bacterium]
MISKNSKNKKTEYWGETPRLNAEETLRWLDGYRMFMFEIWTSNPTMIPQERLKILAELLQNYREPFKITQNKKLMAQIRKMEKRNSAD